LAWLAGKIMRRCARPRRSSIPVLTGPDVDTPNAVTATPNRRSLATVFTVVTDYKGVLKVSGSHVR